MNILDIAKQCCYRTGDPAIANLFADEDNSREWLGYISQAVPSIINEHNWSALTKDVRFTTSGNEQEHPLPDDFNRIATYKLYNLTDKCFIPYGNNDSELDKYMMGDFSQTTIRFRIMGGNIKFTYPIADNQDIIYTYLSNYAVKDQYGVYKQVFSDNNDTFVLSDELLILKAIALRAVNLGLPEVDRREADYQRFLTLEMTNDGANVEYNKFEKGFANKTTPEDWSIYDR
jgi:hypothetical protein